MLPASNVLSFINDLSLQGLPLLAALWFRARCDFAWDRHIGLEWKNEIAKQRAITEIFERRSLIRSSTFPAAYAEHVYGPYSGVPWGG